MPIRAEVRDGILTITIIGDYQQHEFIGAVTEGYLDPRFIETTPVLIDARESRSAISGVEMHAIKRTIIAYRPKPHSGRWAIVTGTEPLRFGIGRMAALTMESMGVAAVVFTDLEQALTFLRAGFDDEGRGEL